MYITEKFLDNSQSYFDGFLSEKEFKYLINKFEKVSYSLIPMIKNIKEIKNLINIFKNKDIGIIDFEKGLQVYFISVEPKINVFDKIIDSSLGRYDFYNEVSKTMVKVYEPIINYINRNFNGEIINRTGNGDG